jgi:hypothetical protein
MLPLAKQSLDEAPYKLSGAIAKLASITFWSIDFSWMIKPWFLTEGNLLLCSSYLCLGVPNYSVIFIITTEAIKQFFWRHCRGLKKKKLPHQLHFPTSTWHQHLPWTTGP